MPRPSYWRGICQAYATPVKRRSYWGGICQAYATPSEVYPAHCNHGSFAAVAYARHMPVYRRWCLHWARETSLGVAYARHMPTYVFLRLFTPYSYPRGIPFHQIRDLCFFRVSFRCHLVHGICLAYAKQQVALGVRLEVAYARHMLKKKKKPFISKWPE